MKKLLLSLVLIGSACWLQAQQITSFTYRTVNGGTQCVNCVDSVGPGVYTQAVASYTSTSSPQGLSVQFAGSPSVQLFIEQNSNQLPSSNCIELVNGGLGWSGWLETNGCGSHGPNTSVRFKLENTTAILEARMCGNSGMTCTAGGPVGTVTVLPGGAWGALVDFDSHHNTAIQFRIVDPGKPAGPNDAGVASIDTPNVFCSGPQNIWTTVENYGNNQVDTVTVNWSYNGILQTPTILYQLLDTAGGTFPTTAQLMLGTVTMTTVDTIMVWTSLPNNINDTVNGNDTMTYIGGPSLNGTYSLGGPGANYPSFTAAVQDLANLGVCGPVIFNVYDSVYTEQISIPVIPGSSGFNTVTFIGATDTTKLTFANTLSTTNYTLRFDGANFVTFDNLTIESTAPTYKTVIMYQNASENNTIRNCTVVQPTPTVSTSTIYALIYANAGIQDNNRFLDNTLDGGSYGIYYRGLSTTGLSDGVRVVGNDFQNTQYMGIYFYYLDNATIDNNKLYYTGNYTGTSYAMFTYYCDNEYKVTNNVIVGDTITQGTSGWKFGLYMVNCDGTAINHQLIANNMISLVDTVYTGTSYGIFMSNNGFQDIVHNSVCLGNNSVNSRTLYAAGGGGNTLENNIIVNNATGYAIYLTTGFTFVSSDYNNLYAPNGNVGFFGTAQATMTGWQTTAGTDFNSFNVDPLFYSKWDLHTCADTLESAGTANGLITYDFDYQTRGAIPDIGADEFATLNGSFLGPDTAKCPGDSVMIGVPGLSGNFAWSTGDSTNTIWVTNPATYILTATSLCGSGSDNVVVTDLPLPVASFTQVVSFYAVTFTSTSTNATSWWWDFGDGNTSTQQHPVHVYAWPGGTFNVTHVAYNNCGNDTTVIVVTADESTGIADNAFAAGVSVYPNPAVGAFNISMTLNQGETVNVEVVSVTGAVVYSEALVGKQGMNVINVEKEIASGSYFVRLRSEHNSAIKKLIIE